jgi:hypothetical protein
MFERNPFLAPQLLGHDKPECVPAQWVKGMGDPNLPSIAWSICI